MATFNNQTIHGNVQQAETINNFAHDATLNSELKSLLIELQTAIGNSTLADKDKQQAITAAQTLAEVSKQPEQGQKNLVGSTLDYFKQLGKDLDGLPETALKLGETVAKIALWFGV
jgi:hypothetical protein